MASIRHLARIARPADDVWAVVSDPAGLTEWFPGVESCTFDGEVRTVATMGIEIQERILTNDDELRRLQYGIVGGPMVPDFHRCTVDVLEDGDGTLLVYSCDVEPDEVGAMMDTVYSQAAANLKAHLES